MNIKRVWTIVAVAALVMIVLGLNWLDYVRTHSPHPSMTEYSAVMAAATEYSHRLKAQGLPVPASVSLPELIAEGVLRQSDVRSFDDLQVTISLKFDETRPQDSLMSVRFPDGGEVIALADGSVQQRVRR